jgi:undecaprenyl-diphosphatase
VTLGEALALGIVQGLTEFLPISSDGHLALAHLMMGGTAAESDLTFDVILHLGTMISIALLLRTRIAELCRTALSLLARRPPSPEEQLQRRWLGLLVAASVPTAIVGLALERTSEVMRLQPLWLGVWFLITAALLVLAERIGTRRRGAEALGMVDALLMGVAQGLAVLPGLSRSGSTVAAGLWRDLEPKVVVDFSLLMSIPAVLGANLLKLPEAENMAAAPLLVGFVSALVTGIGAVKLLQWIVISRRLLPFAVYAALLGLGSLLYGALYG